MISSSRAITATAQNSRPLARCMVFKALDVATRLEDLTTPAGDRLEALKGNQAGPHSVLINDQYRVTFRWEQGHAHEVRIEDYH